MNDNDAKIAVRTTWNCIIGNVFLAAFKLIAGILANSAALVSDAVHSISDVASSFIVIAGVKFAKKKSDKDHPYGHERLECVAAIILAVTLFLVGIGIGYPGVMKIVSGNYDDIAAPGVLALVAAVVSIAVKEAMYWYARRAAKKIDSSALMADAWHHRSDALSSVGSFAGVLGARLGFPVLDPVASVIICLFILRVSIKIFKDATDRMTDKACDDRTVEKIRGLVLTQRDIIRVDRLDTRLFGSMIYVDLEICIDGDASLREAHEVAQRVHDLIEENLPKVKHCMVHMNPSDAREER